MEELFFLKNVALFSPFSNGVIMQMNKSILYYVPKADAHKPTKIPDKLFKFIHCKLLLGLYFCV